MTKQKNRKCVNCNELLNNFVAYIPGKAEACLKCYTEYAKSKEIVK